MQQKAIQAKNNEITQQQKANQEARKQKRNVTIKQMIDENWLSDDMSTADKCYANAIKMVKIALRFAVNTKQTNALRNDTKSLFNSYIDSVTYNQNFNWIQQTAKHSEMLQDILQAVVCELWDTKSIDNGYSVLNSLLYANRMKKGRKL